MQQPSETPALLPRAAGLPEAEFKLRERRSIELQRSLRERPNDVKAMQALADIYMREARVTGEHPYYYPAAESLLLRSFELDSNDYATVLLLGSVMLSQHRFAEALQYADRAVSLAPQSAGGYGVLCDANVELGNYQAAVAALDRMVALRPGLQSYARVSYLRELHGDVDGAIDALLMAVQAGAPGSEAKAWARVTLGNLYLHSGNPDAAHDQYRMAGLERESYPFALEGLAKLAELGGSTTEALDLLDSAYALAPEFSFVAQQAEIYRAGGETQRADSLIAVIAGMLQEDEQSGHTMDLDIALLYSYHDVNMKEAAERSAKVMRQRPNNLDALHTAALLHYRSDRQQEALRCIKQAKRLGSGSDSMLALEGLIENARGLKDRARRLLTASLAENTYLPPLLRSEVRSAITELSRTASGEDVYEIGGASGTDKS